MGVGARAVACRVNCPAVPTSSATNRAYLRRRGIKAVIPVKEDKRQADAGAAAREVASPSSTPRSIRNATPSSAALTCCGNLRAVATRYDKRERIYQGTVDLASIRIWLRDHVT